MYVCTILASLASAAWNNSASWAIHTITIQTRSSVHGEVTFRVPHFDWGSEAESGCNLVRMRGEEDEEGGQRRQGGELMPSREEMGIRERGKG